MLPQEEEEVILTAYESICVLGIENMFFVHTSKYFGLFRSLYLWCSLVDMNYAHLHTEECEKNSDAPLLVECCNKIYINKIYENIKNL